jgi:hypothetical protein
MEHPPEVLQIPPGTPCIYLYTEITYTNIFICTNGELRLRNLQVQLFTWYINLVIYIPWVLINTLHKCKETANNYASDSVYCPVFGKFSTGIVQGACCKLFGQPSTREWAPHVDSFCMCLDSQLNWQAPWAYRSQKQNPPRPSQMPEIMPIVIHAVACLLKASRDSHC